MTTLVELLMAGGGLEGASPKQIRAILAKLETLAVVVENRSLPRVVFGLTDDGDPVVAFRYAMRPPTAASHFAHEHLSEHRAMRAVREAMAVHAAITSTDTYSAAAYDSARDVYLRQHLEAKSVAEGGARSLAEGVL